MFITICIDCMFLISLCLNPISTTEHALNTTPEDNYKLRIAEYNNVFLISHSFGIWHWQKSVWICNQSWSFTKGSSINLVYSGWQLVFLRLLFWWGFSHQPPLSSGGFSVVHLLFQSHNDCLQCIYQLTAFEISEVCLAGAVTLSGAFHVGSGSIKTILSNSF